jgi:hypothetical protein
VANKKDVAKKVGIAIVAKKAIGKVLKLAVLGAVGAAVAKVLRKQPS